MHSPSGNRIQIVMMHPGVLETCPASAQKQNQIAAAMSLLLASRELTPKFGSRPSFPIVCGAEPLHSGPRDICAFKLQAARRLCLYLHPRFELKTPTGIFFLLQFPYNEAESCLPDTSSGDTALSLIPAIIGLGALFKKRTHRFISQST